MRFRLADTEMLCSSPIPIALKADTDDDCNHNNESTDHFSVVAVERVK